MADDTKFENINTGVDMHPKFKQGLGESSNFITRKFYCLDIKKIESQIERIRTEYSLLSIGFKVEVKGKVADLTLYRSTSYMIKDGIKPISELVKEITDNKDDILDFHARIGGTYIPAPDNETCEIILGDQD